MTKFADTQKKGAKRYRVTSCNDSGGTRTECFNNPVDGLQCFYLREREHYATQSPEQLSKKRRYKLTKLLDFYLGYICWKYNTEQIGDSMLNVYQSKHRNARVRFIEDYRDVGKFSEADFSSSALPVKSHRDFIREAYALAVKVGIIARTPFQYNGNFARSKRKRVWIPSQNQVMRLIELAEPREQFAIYLGAVCGLRIGEVLALKRRCVNGDRLELTQRITKTGGIHNGLKYGTSRSVPISRPQFDGVCGALEKTKGALFFQSLRGDHFAVDYYRDRYLRPLLIEAGFQDPRFHALRHYAAREWIKHGIRMSVITQWLGHASPATTYEYYGHLEDGLQNAVKSDLF